MEKIRIVFVERKFDYFVSIENVFRWVGQALNPEEFETSFQKLPFSNNFFGIVKNLLYFRANKFSDIFHVTGHCHYISLILPAERTLLTIHDLGFLHTRIGLRRWALKKLLLDLPLKRLKYVTAVSDATMEEIEKYVPTARGKVRVIENPLDHSLRPERGRKFDEVEPRILQVGTSPNKNVENLVVALKGFPCRLTIIGKMSRELKVLLSGCGIKYESRSSLNAEQIRQEYDRCDIVALCSIYEGFGLPIIEGQAMLKPVVTSNLRPMTDVAGEGGALFVDPNRPEDIRRAIEAIAKDPDLRGTLTKKGGQNVKRFNQRAVTSRYELLYREIACRKNNR